LGGKKSTASLSGAEQQKAHRKAKSGGLFALRGEYQGAESSWLEPVFSSLNETIFEGFFCRSRKNFAEIRPYFEEF